MTSTLSGQFSSAGLGDTDTLIITILMQPPSTRAQKRSIVMTFPVPASWMAGRCPQ